MVGVTKLRIKFGHEGSVKAFRLPDLNLCPNNGSLSQEAAAKKRGPPKDLEEIQPNKKQKKLDRDLSSDCITLLKSLMDHIHGWIFSEPVDPVTLKIPDYFSVISKPMDLGTVKSKLLKNLYRDVDEFGDDVRLTFANAIRYNPPENSVHMMAKELKGVFEIRFDSMMKKKQSDSELRKPVKSLATEVRDKKLMKGLGVSETVKISGKGSVCKCSSCGMITCVCLKSCNSSGSKVSSLKDCKVVNTSRAEASESGPRKEKNGCVDSQLEKLSNETTVPALPPEKALRAAMLKGQFAETILRAKHKKVVDQSNKGDRISIHIEKEQMERNQRQEKARIEAEMRAAKIAAQMRAQKERKQERERSRLALDKFKNTDGFNDILVMSLAKDLVNLCGTSKLSRRWMFKLGLILKDDEETESIGSNVMRRDDLEEGEIL